MSIDAIEIMLPVWRNWGQMLIDAGEGAEIGEERFAP
jgi:hypothetical protein